MTATIGTILDDKYRIVRELGTGGMGAVYEGENLRIRRRVAIKLLHSSVSSQAEAVMRFEREAQAAAQIGSDHICEVLDLGLLPDGTRYMVMEYLEGETLGSRIKRSGRMGPLMSIPIMVQVLNALGAAHAAGIIHRDLKPDNIFILPTKNGINDFVKILDFGVSKFAQNSDEMNMTRAGAVVGTPYYMSPEQARGTSAVDARSDIYALGVLLYQATTGQVPFQAQTFNELLFKIVLEPAPPPQQYAPDLDPEFAAIIQKAMSREPPQRYQSCAEFRDALEEWRATRVGPMPVPMVGGRPATLSPNAGLVRPQTPPGGLMSPLTQSQPSWAVSSGAGVPPVNALSTSGTQNPATANAWGNASGVGQPAKPGRSGLAVGLITAAAIALLGGGGLAFFFMRVKHPPPQPPVTATTAAPTLPPETAQVPTPTAPPPTEPSAAPSVSASAMASAVPVDSAATSPTSAAPRTTTQPTAVNTRKTPPPPPTGNKKPKPPGGSGDLGY